MPGRSTRGAAVISVTKTGSSRPVSSVCDRRGDRPRTAVNKRNGKNGHKNGKEALLKPKIINGKVWVPEGLLGSYVVLPETDPAYRATLDRIDSERFVELLEWVYNRPK
jgi:hypothetical protein